MKALLFLYTTITELYLYVIILRGMMIVAGISIYDPIARFVFALTDPIFKPLHSLLPRGQAFKISAIVLTVVVAIVWTFLMRWLLTFIFECGQVSLMSWAQDVALVLTNTVLRLYWLLLLIYVVLSWIDPMGRQPIGNTLARLCQPLLKPVRRVVPVIGGIDITPIIPFLIIGALMVQFPPPNLPC
ncbi:MAG: YggT family protein [Gammaproteobacteria bacterium]|nr:YggT family protein [Gammaproteobacteria bacterium]